MNAWTRTRTTCPYCGVGCGVLADVEAAGCGTPAVHIKGDPEHPANFGRLCSKGSALAETLSLDDRLLHPSVDGQMTSWDRAIETVAVRFRETIAAHGPGAVAMYVSGQMLTEDYYVANKFMKGFIGTANIDTNSRLCMSSSVAGHKRAFGTDTVPGVYEDLELADLVVLVGSNLAWCHPVLYQRLAAAREERGTKVVVIDPRATATCDIADLHLALEPGSDIALFNGLLAHLQATGRIDQEYVARATNGWENTIDAATALTFDDVVAQTGLGSDALACFFELFATTQRVLTVYSQGVNQSSAGTDKVNAIINCHLATGRIGRPGMGPFSVTGQPNAMGGREVGGLANMLAAHMELEDSAHRRIVSKFWGVSSVPDRSGLKAVDLFNAIAEGRIKAVWIMATNPVDSLPDADAVRAALAQCPFVVVSDITARTDTAELADVLLPSTAWGEKDGTVTNSERRISRQRSFLYPPGQSRPDWWQICRVADRMGFVDAFRYAGPHEIFAEHAALTGAGNDGTRDLDISAHASISRQDYNALEPFQWGPRATDAETNGRFFADGKFFTSDKRANLVPVRYRPPASAVDREFPLVLNTGRIRDQWHTMTRTAKTPKLLTHVAEPFVEVHPLDAAEYGLEPAGLGRVRSRFGSMIARVSVSERQRRGSIFVPMHWTDQHATAARVGAVVAPNTDPISGQPESKYGAVSIEAFNAAWYGFAVTCVAPPLATYEYAARARAGIGYRLEFAGRAPVIAWPDIAADLLTRPGAASERQILSYCDEARGQHRFAAFAGGECIGLLYVAREPVPVSRSWAIDQLGAVVAPRERRRLLAGRPSKDVPDQGAIVCACFSVGANEIVRAVVEGGCRTTAEVGQCLGAGTNCGSCRSEIGRLVNEHRFETAV